VFLKIILIETVDTDILTIILVEERDDEVFLGYLSEEKKENLDSLFIKISTEGYLEKLINDNLKNIEIKFREFS